MNKEEAGLPSMQLYTDGITDVYRCVDWETRDAVITGENGQVVFEQRGVEVPASWSQLATNIVASKYFRGQLGSSLREFSAWQMISRVVYTIVEWGQQDGYFDRESGATFAKELSHVLLNQMAFFNSPVWFNIGVPDTPPQASACFIISVDDDMNSILDWYRQEGVIFKGGSGSGVNLSRLRSSGEPLSGGGMASGPLTFMRAADASAGAIKSGGTCLPASQKVYTANGPIEVGKLAELPEFVTLSYDPPAGRFKAKKAQAWLSGFKPIVRVTTDKGRFYLSHDHPVRLSTGEFIRAGELQSGFSLHKCTIDLRAGYLRVGLQDGRKGKRYLHRLVAEDVMGIGRDMPVHHADHDKMRNEPDNLHPMTQSEHARLHSVDQVNSGEHIFQKRSFPKRGTLNPMHRNSGFWGDPVKAGQFSAKQSAIMKPKSKGLQDVAATQRMVNLAQRILNSGGSIATLEDYFDSRSRIVGKIADKHKVARSIEKRFGSYAGFLAAVDASNHRVVSVEHIGSEPVYSVEVECPTPDDKTPRTGHNYVIWPDGGGYAGSGIVVSNTRRSAKMVVLNADHPDVLEFIECKVREERKAHALIDAGYDPSLDGDAYGTVAFQNANNSVRVSDGFMEVVEQDGGWETHNRRDGSIAGKHRARDLFRKIAGATWECGDPGMQFDDTINSWHTCPGAGRQEATNPCSEYCWINDSACNLASLNLLKFLRKDGTFDTVAFCHTIRLMITAQDILVSHAAYPTEAIERNSHAYRTLGLGYANLGALLMTLGLPYDSDAGRAYAASVTSLMTACAYSMSADLASCLGPFSGFKENRKAMLDVIDRHQEASKDARTPDSPPEIHDAAYGVWHTTLLKGSKSGFRNAQVTLLAPTGTIGLAMDCDTTGVEPDLALVKHKRLVGGGSLRIVNKQLQYALERLGYSPELVAKITQYVDENGTVEGCPDLQTIDHPVFDCAFPAQPGGRAISYQGHLKMVAAVQPFLSGAVSKTINMPNDSTVEDIEQTYMDAWKSGVKCVAIYRDGCKRTQPLSTGGNGIAKDEAMLDEYKRLSREGAIRHEAPQAVRRHLPDERTSITHKFSIAGHEGYVTVGLYEDGTPGELFLVMSKEGSTVSGLMDGLATAVSIALQHGVPLRTLIDKFSHVRFEPTGFTNNPEIPIAKSVTDYVFRWLASKFLTREEQDQIGVVLRDGSPPSLGTVSIGSQEDAPPCTICGAIMTRNGSCYSCQNCGVTSGCS